MTHLKIFLIEHWYHRGKTDADLARALGVSKPEISRWINGVREPCLERKLQIAKVLEADSRLIFPEEEQI